MRPRIIIAALKGGSGKTVLSLGLAASWREGDRLIAPFKKGPDFIDAGWLAFAGAGPCYNLDPFLMNQSQILRAFLRGSDGADISIIEGNRGLFDGLDIDGCCSTAELARLLKAPVLLIVDVTMSTRTIAAVIKGCQVFDPALNLAGVILNRVANGRQERLIKAAIRKYCGIPVVGAVPRLKENPFPERHMGLVPHQERGRAGKAVSWAKKTAEDYLELDRIWDIAHNVLPFDASFTDSEPRTMVPQGLAPPRIGFIEDRAFWFYYPENLERLEDLGAVLVPINALSDGSLPAIDGLYIGGGFPETQARDLACNNSFRESLKEAIKGGLPVYAECGGFMYLGERIIVDDRAYPMVGAVPMEFILQKKPQGHGYTVLEVTEQNPFYPVGRVVRGHEFHYSRPVAVGDEKGNFVFKVARGRGVDGKVDGFCKGALLASYTHVHAGGDPEWGKGLVKAAVAYRERG